MDSEAFAGVLAWKPGIGSSGGVLSVMHGSHLRCLYEEIIQLFYSIFFSYTFLIPGQGTV